MTTPTFVPKSELFDWLRGSVRRRENVALKIVTDPRRDTITLRLSDGRLVYVNCEDHGPLDALVLLVECDQVRFSYTSVKPSERRELMSSPAFLAWLDTADATPSDALDADSSSTSRTQDGERWSGTLRGGTARKGSARVGAAVAAVAVVAVVAYFVAGDFGDGSGVDVVRTSTRIDGPGTESVNADLVESTTWRAGRTYRLEGLVFVEGRARLVIEPGVTVLGGPSAALIVTRDASIQARGTAAKPIVFTSAKPEGTRTSGDWGGVVLLGNAPTNRGEATVEGIPASDARGAFGGKDERSNCGVLEYVRIEFAGYPIGANNELNGLTLGGCGRATLVRHVQVHRAYDDGIEIFGGTVDFKHVLVTQAGDDSVDWDMGWAGRGQFVIVQQHPQLGDNGFEGDNSSEEPEAEPISRPRIYNVTMVGTGGGDRTRHAMVIRNGSGGEFRNMLITGFAVESIDLRGELTAERVASGTLSFGGIALSSAGSDDVAYFIDESGAADDDGGFDELRYFSERAPDVLLDAPQPLGPEAWSLTEPDFTPVAAYIGAGSQSAPPIDEEFWDETASYYGAVRYGEGASWTHGWTAYPER